MMSPCRGWHAEMSVLGVGLLPASQLAGGGQEPMKLVDP